MSRIVLVEKGEMDVGPPTMILADQEMLRQGNEKAQCPRCLHHVDVNAGHYNVGRVDDEAGDGIDRLGGSNLLGCCFWRGLLGIGETHDLLIFVILLIRVNTVNPCEDVLGEVRGQVAEGRVSVEVPHLCLLDIPMKQVGGRGCLDNIDGGILGVETGGRPHFDILAPHLEHALHEVSTR